MLVDYERVVLRLREEVAARQGIGATQLLALIGRLEVECAVEEGVPERALRLYGVALSDDLIRGIPPAPSAAHARPADGQGSASSNGAQRHEGSTNGLGHHAGPAGHRRTGPAPAAA